MYAQTIALENEKKRKRQSAWMTLLFLLFMGVLVALPLFNHFMNEDDPNEYQAVLTVDFTEFGKASKKPAEEGTSGSEMPTPKKVETPTPKVQPAPPKPPVITTKEPAPPVVTAPKKVKVTPKPRPRPVPVEKAEKPAPTPAKPKIKIVNKSKKKSNRPGKTAGQGTGTTGSGTASEGANGTDATPGDGDDGMDFSGNGIFGRKVTYRADVKKITKKEGTVVVNLCVDPAGKVIYAAANNELTTMKDRSVVKKAVSLTRKYRFEKDWNAPAKECGKLTYIFDLNE